ncbi:MAG: hydroxymethylbilane synthase [Verrucomicrobia bacterium]|nr:hydroxymethylbilane synthase [Verrucomicrobiota bacterium]
MNSFASTLVRVVTRKSPLAMAQTELAIAWLCERIPGLQTEILPMSTVGDERLNWSLAEKGGKGLFTSALEEAMLKGMADLAVHSAKDLPTEMPDGLSLAGYLPREDARDALVVRAGVALPNTIATGSPRRREQLRRLYPEANWVEIRGNVGTRMDKIRSGVADATVMAMAGLKRLGLTQPEGLSVLPFSLEDCIPAAGQGAIALQCRQALLPLLEPVLCQETKRAVDAERSALAVMGGGCQSAAAAHFHQGQLHCWQA